MINETGLSSWCLAVRIYGDWLLSSIPLEISHEVRQTWEFVVEQHVEIIYKKRIIINDNDDFGYIEDGTGLIPLPR